MDPKAEPPDTLLILQPVGLPSVWIVQVTVTTPARPLSAYCSGYSGLELPMVGEVLGPLSGTAAGAGADLVKLVCGGGARVTA